MVVARPLCVDISKYQGLNVNWKAYVAWAKQWDGIARVIMRSSYGAGGLRDDDFEAHWSGAVAAGCDVIGVYHEAHPTYNQGAQGATKEADSQFAVVGKRLRDNDFLILDWEEESPDATPSWAYTWLTRQRSNYAGRMPRIYVDPSFAAAHCQDSRLTQFPLMLAHWTFDPNSTPPAPRPWTTYEYLEWSDTATVPGVPGRAEMNFFEQQVMTTSPAAMAPVSMLSIATPPAAMPALSLPPIAPPPAAMSPGVPNPAPTNPLMMSPLLPEPYMRTDRDEPDRDHCLRRHRRRRHGPDSKPHQRDETRSRLRGRRRQPLAQLEQ